MSGLNIVTFKHTLCLKFDHWEVTQELSAHQDAEHLLITGARADFKSVRSNVFNHSSVETLGIVDACRKQYAMSSLLMYKMAVE